MRYAYLLIQEQLQNKEWVRRWFGSVKRFPFPAFILFEPFEDQVESIHFTAKRISHYLSEQLFYAHYVMGHHYHLITETASGELEWHSAFLEPFLPKYHFLVIGNTFLNQHREALVLPISSLIQLLIKQQEPEWILFPTLFRSPLAAESHHLNTPADLTPYLEAYPEEPVLQKIRQYQLFPVTLHAL